MPRKVGWALVARQELLSTIQRLVDQSALGPAGQLLDQIEAAAGSLSNFPERGRVVPEFGPPRRELIVEGYRLVYRVRADEVHILRLIHGKQNFLATWRKPT